MTIQLGDPNVRFTTPEEAFVARVCYALHSHITSVSQQELDIVSAKFIRDNGSFAKFMHDTNEQPYAQITNVSRLPTERYERPFKLSAGYDVIRVFKDPAGGWHIY